MATYAQLNLKLKKALTNAMLKNGAALAKRMTEATIEGAGEGGEAIYNPYREIVCVRIPYQGLKGMMEAGAVLGYCHKTAEVDFGGSFDVTWFSAHSEKQNYSAI